MQVKAALRSLPNAQAQLQDAEAACFATQRLHLQTGQNELVAAPDRALVKHNTQALQALQMLLLLLDFPKHPSWAAQNQAVQKR